METKRSQPRRGVIEVASHFRSALPLGLSKNGWYSEVQGGRAFRYATRHLLLRTYGMPATHHYLPAIEMAGYHCLMPTASAVQSLQNLNN